MEDQDMALFEIMLDDWKADNADIVEDMFLGEIETITDETGSYLGCFAEDESGCYLIADTFGTGILTLNYIGN